VRGSNGEVRVRAFAFARLPNKEFLIASLIQPGGLRIFDREIRSSEFRELTEVHVPEQAKVPCWHEKAAFGADFSANALIRLTLPFRSKYQSYWYGNPLALTIYVNANELRLSPND
jgi:hypothetical protein